MRPLDLLTYDWSGQEDGDVLLMLNGGFMSMASWAPCLPRLEDRMRVLRCDFRGQLLTPGTGHSDLGLNVGDVIQLLDHLHLDRVHVLGTSFGGEVALMMAARHPDRVNHLVAVAVGDQSAEPTIRGAREIRQLIEEIRQGGDRALFHDYLLREVFSEAFIAENKDFFAERRKAIGAMPLRWFEGCLPLLAAIESFDLREELSSIQSPTLVLLAEGDEVIPVESGRAVARAIPAANLKVHPSSGHALVTEEPTWLVDQVFDFLGELAC